MNGAHITPSASAGWGEHHDHSPRVADPDAMIAALETAQAELHALAAQQPTIDLAIQIADEAARSDVECYAAGEWSNDVCWYDLSRAEVSGVFTADDIKHAFDVANRSAQYIALRGEALSYRMLRHPDNDMLVRFEVKSS